MGGKVVIGTGAGLVFGGLACIGGGYFGCQPLFTFLGILLVIVAVILAVNSGI